MKRLAFLLCGLFAASAVAAAPAYAVVIPVVMPGGYTRANPDELLVIYKVPTAGIAYTVTVRWSLKPDMRSPVVLYRKSFTEPSYFYAVFKPSTVPDNTQVYFEAMIATKDVIAGSGVHGYVIRH